MAIKSTADLLTEANLIKNATIPGENTALRVGGTLVDMIDSQPILPPQPIMYIPKDPTVNGLQVLFMDNGYDFSVGNPELFLFRYKNSKTKKKNGGIVKLRPRYYHPSTGNASVKWAGWKFFSGYQNNRNGTGLTRTTEWALPPTLKPYEKFDLTAFNKYMFWQEVDKSTGLVSQNDSNVFIGNNYTLTNAINVSNPDLIINLTGFKQNGAKEFKRPKVVKYAFAVGIDNPNATKANGLCPKIFGPMSEPIYAMLYTNNYSTIGPVPIKPGYVILVNQDNSRLSRPARLAKF